MTMSVTHGNPLSMDVANGTEEIPWKRISASRGRGIAGKATAVEMNVLEENAPLKRSDQSARYANT